MLRDVAEYLAAKAAKAAKAADDGERVSLSELLSEQAGSEQHD